MSLISQVRRVGSSFIFTNQRRGEEIRDTREFRKLANGDNTLNEVNTEQRHFQLLLHPLMMLMRQVMS